MDIQSLLPWQRIALLNPCVEAEDTHNPRFYFRSRHLFDCAVGFTLNVGLE